MRKRKTRSKPRAAAYDETAYCYDRLWGPHVHRYLSPILNKLLLPHLAAGEHVLDLCCGTGQVAAYLVRRGFRATGIDLSRGMLRCARRNAPSARFIAADARAFRLPPVFSGVTCTFDALNHILRPADFARVLRNVHAALRPRGWFLFDMNLPEAFRTRWHRSGHDFRHDLVWIAESSYNPRTKIGTLRSVMLRPAGKRWKREDLTVRERCYSRAEILAALRRCGFRSVRTFDAVKSFHIPSRGRTYFLARRG